MKSVSYSESVMGSIELEQVLVTKEELERFYNGVDHVDSNSTRYSQSYEKGLEAAYKVLELMQPDEGEGLSLESALERALEQLGWLAGIFCRMCLRTCGNLEVVELNPNQVYVFGGLADKSALTMHINERSVPGELNRGMSVVLKQANKRTRCTYVRYDNWTKIMEERSEMPAYALVRTQICLFIERLAYEDLYQKERKNLIQFIKAVPGIYVVLEP